MGAFRAHHFVFVLGAHQPDYAGHFRTILDYSRRFAQSAGPGMCTVVSFNLLFFLVVVVVVVVVGDVFFQTRLQSV